MVTLRIRGAGRCGISFGAECFTVCVAAYGARRLCAARPKQSVTALSRGQPCTATHVLFDRLDRVQACAVNRFGDYAWGWLSTVLYKVFRHGWK